MAAAVTNAALISWVQRGDGGCDIGGESGAADPVGGAAPAGLSETGAPAVGSSAGVVTDRSSHGDPSGRMPG
jgi:hypothetical protein